LYNSKLNGRKLGFNTPLSVFLKDTAMRCRIGSRIKASQPFEY